MPNEIIVALITGGLVLAGVLVTARVNLRIDEAKRRDLLDALPKKLALWEKLPDGEQKDKLWASIGRNTDALAERDHDVLDKKSVAEWALPIAGGAAAISVAAWIFGGPVVEAHTVLVRANPSMTLRQGWVASATTAKNGHELSARGARISDVGAEVTTNEWDENNTHSFRFTLKSISPASKCNPGGTALILIFHAKADSHLVQGPPLFAPRDFYAVSDAGDVIADAAALCPNSDGIVNVEANKDYDHSVAIRVPTPHGNVGYRWVGEGGPVSWEWRY